jgi:hypothetical protein
VPDEHTPSGGGEADRDLLAASPENRDLPLNEEPLQDRARHGRVSGRRCRAIPRCTRAAWCFRASRCHELTPTFISNKGYANDALRHGRRGSHRVGEGGRARARRSRGDARRDAQEPSTWRVARNESPFGLERKLAEPWQDPQVWELISGGYARAVHHIESPAMTSLCRQTNVRDIDTAHRHRQRDPARRGQ